MFNNKFDSINFKSLHFWIIYCFFILLSSVFMHAKLGMDASWDTAHYHIFLGWTFINSKFGAFGSAAQYHSYLNPLIDAVNFLTFFAHPYLGAAFHSLAHLAFACIIMKLIQEFLSHTLKDRVLALIGCAISLTGAMTVSLFGSWTNENIVAVPVLVGLYILIKGIKGDKPLLFLLAGISFGAATGLKLTAAHYMVGAFFVALICSFRIKTVIFLFLGMVLGFVLVDGYFMYVRWDLTKNPIFPFANNIFHSPYYIGGWKSYSQFEFSKIFYYLSLPLKWLSSGDFSEAPTIRDGRLLLAYLSVALIVISSFLSKNIDRARMAIVVFFTFSFLAWILFFRIYRYLIVLEVLSGILFVVGLKTFFERISQKASLFTALSFLPVLWHVTHYPDWGRRPWNDIFVSSNISDLLDENKNSIVFFAERQVSYFAVSLERLGVKFANLYSQPWWDGERALKLENNSIDPQGWNIQDFDQVYFLQPSRDDPRAQSAYLRALYTEEHYTCRKVRTNNFLAPYLCSFKKDSELPRIELGVEYKHNADNIIFQNGWSYHEPLQLWTDGTEAALLLSPNREKPFAPHIIIRGDTFGRQSVEILVNYRKVFSGNLEGHFVLKIDVPFHVRGGKPMKIKFKLPTAREAGNGDKRRLALAFQSILVAESKK